MGAQPIVKGRSLRLLLRDAGGTMMEFAGEIQGLVRGRMLEVTAYNIASKFDGWPCEWSFGQTTLSAALRQIIENPTGRAATGIIAHVEEITWVEPVAGATVPVTLTDWSGQGRSVAAVLDEFGRTFGLRYYCESRDGVDHCWVINPATSPIWGTTIRDDIDYADESSTQMRLDDGGGYPLAQAEDGPKYNRVRFYARAESPRMLTGWHDWDDWLGEDLTYWRPYGKAVALGTTSTHASGYGAAAVTFTYTYTVPANGAPPPPFVDLGYAVVPGQLADMSSIYWGYLTAQARKTVTTSQGIPSANIPMSDVMVQLVLHSGANVGPSAMTGCSLDANLRLTTIWAQHKWQLFGKAESRSNNNGETVFDLASVTAVQLRAQLRNPGRVTKMNPGTVFTLTVTLDHIRPIGGSGQGGPATGQYYVETAAVSAGTEVPVEMRLDDMGMSLGDAELVAQSYLTRLQLDAESIGPVALVGIQNVPMRSNIPLRLRDICVDDSYPIAEITWEPLAADGTTLTLGAIPADDLRRDEQIKRHINRLGAAVRSA